MSDTLTEIPDEFVAGDTWAWTRSLADYPAGTWTAKTYFENGQASYSTTATASGTDHAFSIAKATTADYKAGRYLYRLVVDDGTTRKSIESGFVNVLPDPEAAGNVDHRTPARVMLDNINAYLTDANNLAAASYSIGGRSLSRYSAKELHDLRDRLKSEVAAEDRRTAALSGRPVRNRLLARM